MKVLRKLDDWGLLLLTYVSTLVSSLVLVLAGWQHLTAPEASTLADLLAMIDVTVSSSLGLSLSGALTLFVMLVGLTVLLNGVGLALYVVMQLLDRWR